MLVRHYHVVTPPMLNQLFSPILSFPTPTCWMFLFVVEIYWPTYHLTMIQSKMHSLPLLVISDSSMEMQPSIVIQLVAVDTNLRKTASLRPCSIRPLLILPLPPSSSCKFGLMTEVLSPSSFSGVPPSNPLLTGVPLSSFSLLDILFLSWGECQFLCWLSAMQISQGRRDAVQCRCNRFCICELHLVRTGRLATVCGSNVSFHCWPLIGCNKLADGGAADGPDGGRWHNPNEILIVVLPIWYAVGADLLSCPEITVWLAAPAAAAKWNQS